MRQPTGKYDLFHGLQYNAAMADSDQKLPSRSSSAEVAAFLEKVERTPAPVNTTGSRGRLLFAMDATASREPMWDRACHIQGEMFMSTRDLGGLEVKLCFYRGFHEFFAGKWCQDASTLLRQMSSVRCAGGMTQIGRVLKYAVKQTREYPVNAVVFVGDCMEENVDRLCDTAGQLGLLGLPVFVFHEGFDTVAEHAFKEIARLSRGAYCRFDAGISSQLKELLRAVAVFAAGGKSALDKLGREGGGLVKQLGHQISGQS